MSLHLGCAVFYLFLHGGILVSANHIDSLPETVNKILQYKHVLDDREFIQDSIIDLKDFNLWNAFKSNANILQSHSGSLQRTTSQCFNHSLYVLDALRKKETQTQAFTFLDAFGKLPSGVLEGAFAWYGQFSECRNISLDVSSVLNASSAEVIRGQYCYADILKKINGSAPPVLPQSESNVGVFRVGVCVPEACDTSQTTLLLQDVIDLASSDYIVRVTCKSNSNPELQTGAIVSIVIFAILGILITIATLYDYALQIHIQNIPKFNEVDSPNQYHEGNELAREGGSRSSPEGGQVDVVRPNTMLGVNEYTPLLGSASAPTVVKLGRKSLCIRLLLCFSVLTNAAKLLSTRPSSKKNLSAIHGIRFISMSWVILGHTIVFLFSTTIKNPAAIVTYFQSYSFQAILNATVSVDTFFLLSGALGSYLLLEKLTEAAGVRQVNWGLVYFHRFWRLTPPYMLVIAYYTTLYHHMGSGPLFPETPDEFCTDSWWKNLLYINNFFPTMTGCISWTWYLANDMQFFILLPIVVIALYKWLAVGVILILSLILTHLLTTGILTRYNGYPFDFAGIIMMNSTDPQSQMDYMDQLYVRPYSRVGPYAVGIALGYILHRTGLQPRLNKVLVLLGWLLAFACCFSVIYATFSVSSGHTTLSPGVNAFYAAVHRVVWALGVAWVIYACVTGYGGPVNTLLSWPALVPLSRLTYMAYLVHPIIMAYVYTSQEQTIYLNNLSLVYLFISHLVLSYGVAFITSLALEAPMMALEKIVFG